MSAVFVAKNDPHFGAFKDHIFSYEMKQCFLQGFSQLSVRKTSKRDTRASIDGSTSSSLSLLRQAQ